MAIRKSELDWLQDYVVKTSEAPADEEKSWWGGLDGKTLFGTFREGVAASDVWASRFPMDPSAESARPEILRSVRRVANVMSNATGSEGERELTVRWANFGTTNNVSSSVVYINPDVADKVNTRQPRWTDAERLDVLVAEALTESAMKRTVSRAAEAYMSTAIPRPGVSERDLKLQALVWHAAERLFAEGEVVKNYHGYAEYFARSRAYYTDAFAKEDTQEAVNAEESVLSATQALLWTMMHPEQKLELSPGMAKAIDKALDRVRVAETSDQRAKAAERTIEHFLELWPDKEEEQEEEDKPGDKTGDPGDECNGGKGGKGEGDGEGDGDGDQDEDDEEDKDEEDKDEEDKKDGSPESDGSGSESKKPTSTSGGGPRKLSSVEDLSSVGVPKAPRDAGDAVKGRYYDLGDAEAPRTLDDVVNWKGGTVIAHVLPERRHRKVYQDSVSRLRPQIVSLRNRLKFRAEDQKLLEHGMRRGRLDEGSLHKLCFTKYYGVDDPNVFESEEILAPPSVAFLLLVDESGSMSCGGSTKNRRIDQARDCAIVISNAVKALPGVDVAVMGHSGQGGYLLNTKTTNGLSLHTYYSPETPEIEALGCIQHYCENLDGYAIGQAVKKLEGWYPHADAHVLVHISDGQPSAGGYAGHAAMRHVGTVCQMSRAQGVQVVGVGIDNAFDDRAGKMMYGPNNFVVLPSAEAYFAVSNVLVNAVHSRKAAA